MNKLLSASGRTPNPGDLVNSPNFGRGAAAMMTPEATAELASAGELMVILWRLPEHRRQAVIERALEMLRTVPAPHAPIEAA